MRPEVSFLLGFWVAVIMSLWTVVGLVATNTLEFEEATIGGTPVSRDLDCFEDEAIAFVAKDTLACVHIEDIDTDTNTTLQNATSGSESSVRRQPDNTPGQCIGDLSAGLQGSWHQWLQYRQLHRGIVAACHYYIPRGGI